MAYYLAWVAQNCQGYNPSARYTVRQIRALYGRNLKAPARGQADRVASYEEVLAAYYRSRGVPEADVAGRVKEHLSGGGG